MTYPGDIQTFDVERQFRLQQLRDEFEATVDEVLAMLSLPVFEPKLMKNPDFYIEVWSKVTPPEPCEVQATILARRYIIARDFNEFDPKRADMLWKLQSE